MFSFSDEQEQYRDAVRRWVLDNSSLEDVRRCMSTDRGYEPEVWRSLCEGMGLPGVHVPEEYGGQGFGLVELAIALEEMGSGLLCSPFFGSSVLTSTAILESGSAEMKEQLLPDLASGKALGALAVSERGGLWSADDVTTTVRRQKGRLEVSGEKRYVIDGLIADFIVVIAREEGTSGEQGIRFLVVEAGAEGVKCSPMQSIDETRKLSVVSFDRVSALPLSDEEGFGALRKTFDVASIALANEMVGGASKLLDSAVDYANLRVQFGRVIGSFQAIKHKCADVLLRVELAKSAAYGAAGSTALDDDELSTNASLAKALASEAFLEAAAQTIQIHGGIGFTWENDTHLYFKRAKSGESLLGQPHEHRERFLRYGHLR